MQTDDSLIALGHQHLDSSDHKEDEYFEGEEITQFLAFNRLFPARLQDQLDRYTDKRVQIYKESTEKNAKNLKRSNPMEDAFNLL